MASATRAMRFEFATATRIVFGSGALDEVGAMAAELGRRFLVVTGRDASRAARLLDQLGRHGLEAITVSIAREPTVEDVIGAVNAARHGECDAVIGFGGGAALDAAKAVSALLTNEGDPLDYLEVVGRGKPLARQAAPYIAIPTTAGTGSEVTRNAVLASPAHRVKVSLRGAQMLPRIALVDPILTHELPPALTASTGLDALTQLIEPYVCPRANPLTDAYCVDGIQRAARSLRRAVESSRDTTAREDMALAGLFGGLALANAGLGAVHGFAGPIGGMFPAPHGAVCAALLPHVMAANLDALRAREPGHVALRRYDEVARLLTGGRHATADDAVRWIAQLVADLRIPALSAFGLQRSDAADVVTAAQKASSMKANPVVLTPTELTAIFERAL